MDNKEMKSFNLITDMLYTELKEKSYVKKPFVDNDEEMSVIMQNENLAYKVAFGKETNLYTLSNCVIAQGNDNEDVYENWKVIVTWLFDPEVSTTKDAEDIGKDFVRTVFGEKQKKLAKTAKKKKKSDESNADPIFFFNRLVNVFPELKQEINEEKNTYEDFRAVTFTREKVLPKIAKILKQGENARIKKLCTILSNMYDAGDLDVKGLITYVILNSITDTEQKALVNELLSDNLKKAWSYSITLIGKNIKPEKVKTKKSFISRTLDSK